MNIVVIGMGYVGIPCAVLLADVEGFSVTGVQRRSERSGWKIDCLNEGRSPFAGDEPGLAELIARVVKEKKSFRVTDDYGVCREADTILIDVQTPTDGDHVPHYESLREVSAQVGRHLRPGTLVIVESTVAPGTTQGVVQPILEEASGLKAEDRKQEAGGRRQEAGGRRQEAGSRRQEAGGRRQEAGSRRQEAGGRRQEAGSRRQEAGGRRQEAGGRRQEAGGRRQEAEGEGRFYLAFSYERVMPGKLLEYIQHFPRVVGGVDAESTRRAVEFYGHIVKAALTPADVLTAEMAKVVENAYRDVNIAFANEVALACERMGVDVFQVRELINARPDRQMHIPGAGVGGHCLPKDSWLLAYGLERYGGLGNGRLVDWEGLRLIPLAREINEGMPEHMLALIKEGLAEAGCELAGARVAVLGASYLENADDTRNTPAAALARLLVASGANVVVHDPHVRSADWQRAYDGQGNGAAEAPLTADLWWALEGADCAALVTRHREYTALDPRQVGEVMRRPVLVDGRNVWQPAICREAGIHYRGIGKR